MTYLLDVNVLVALLDRMHQYHAPAKTWFDTVGFESWGTCPITENGVLRVLGGASYGNQLGGVIQIAELLRPWIELPGHVFWPDDVSLIGTNVVSAGHALTLSQITDVYLLLLARSRGGELATFDRRIPSSAIEGGEDTLRIVDDNR